MHHRRGWPSILCPCELSWTLCQPIAAHGDGSRASALCGYPSVYLEHQDARLSLLVYILHSKSTQHFTNKTPQDQTANTKVLIDSPFPGFKRINKPRETCQRHCRLTWNKLFISQRSIRWCFTGFHKVSHGFRSWHSILKRLLAPFRRKNQIKPNLTHFVSTIFGYGDGKRTFFFCAQ